MAKTFRLTDKEVEWIRVKSTEINKILINSNKEPLRDSELLHKILEKTVRYVKVTKNGEIYIDV